MRRAVGMILVGAMALAACTDDGGGEARSPSAPGAPESADDRYADALSGALAAFQRDGTAAFEDVEAAVAADDLDEAMVLAGPALESVSASLDDTIATVEQLEPPDDYRADQQGVLGALETLAANFDNTATAAKAGDGDAFLQAGADRDDLLEATLANLSPTVAGRFAMATTVVEDFPDLSDEEVAYLGAVNAAFLEFASRNAEFGQALNQSYSDSPGLLAALLDAGAGTAFAAVLDQVQAADPPAAFDTDHDRTVAYLEDAVAADEEVAAAAEAGDLPGFLVANEELAGLARQARLDLTGPPLRAVFPNPAPPPESLEGDEYSLGVWQQMDILADTFAAGDFPGYVPFSVATDEETTAAIAGMAPPRTTWVDTVRSALTAVDVPAASAPVHARLVEYVDELLALQDTLATTAERGDVAATLATLEGLTRAWCGAGAELNAGLGPAAGNHLGPTATDPRCSS